MVRNYVKSYEILCYAADIILLGRYVCWTINGIYDLLKHSGYLNYNNLFEDSALFSEIILLAMDLETNGLMMNLRLNEKTLQYALRMLAY